MAASTRIVYHSLKLPDLNPIEHLCNVVEWEICFQNRVVLRIKAVPKANRNQPGTKVAGTTLAIIGNLVSQQSFWSYRHHLPKHCNTLFEYRWESLLPKFPNMIILLIFLSAICMWGFWWQVQSVLVAYRVSLSARLFLKLKVRGGAKPYK